MRPPIVARSSSVLQRGQCPPRVRWAMKVPVWTPPLRIASRVAARSTRRRWSSSASESDPAGVRGDSRARHSVSSASRLPTPEIEPWSSRRAFSAIVPRPTRSRKTSRETSAASGPDVVEVRLDHGAAEPSLVAQREPAAVGELEREAVPADRLLVDHDPPGHPEVQPEIRPAVGLGPQELAAPAGVREPAAGQRRRDLPGRVGAADVGIGVVDGDDLAPQRPLDLLAGALGLWEFRHMPEATILGACLDHDVAVTPFPARTSASSPRPSISTPTRSFSTSRTRSRRTRRTARASA